MDLMERFNRLNLNSKAAPAPPPAVAKRPPTIYQNAAQAAKHFSNKIRDIFGKRPTEFDLSDLSRLYFYAMLSNFFGLITAGKPLRKTEQQQSGGAADAASLPYQNFLQEFPPKDENGTEKVTGPVEWPLAERVAFFKNRYEALFRFSELYFAEWQKASPTEYPTYAQFIEKRVDQLIAFTNNPALVDLIVM